MKRILVVYYSQTGHTEFVARQIALQCRATLERIETYKQRESGRFFLFSSLESLLRVRPSVRPGRHRPGKYDVVVVGTPVWCWNVASPVRSWLHRHRGFLPRVAFFCTFGGSGGAKVLGDMEAISGQSAVARLAVKESAVAHSQHDPDVRRFIAEVTRAARVPVDAQTGSYRSPATEPRASQ